VRLDVARSVVSKRAAALEACLGVGAAAAIDSAYHGAEYARRLLLLSGAPSNEPVVGYGPFMMTDEDEIRQAFDDYRSGRMGRIAEPV
jgi:redox-sensitive bicupin YhaK (pirin superfamily)